MPEEETPGVYIDEIDPGPRPIEAVSTSVLGIAGVTERGPFDAPVLVTSRSAFTDLFGGMRVGGRPRRVAQAADAFFLNGGQHLWMQRIPEPTLAALADGLAALAGVDDISVVATPDAADLPVEECAEAAGLLVAHCEERRDRFGLVDPPPGLDTDGVLAFRARFDSAWAATYHPWLHVPDPDATPAGALLAVPPSGTVAGIYARVDLSRGVHKAPANEPLHGVVALASEVSTSDQERLNPAGVNAFRSFPGRGLRVWGARTMSSDPEWKYVNIRRYLTFLERSIDTGTQWAVFEPNAEPLWAAVRRSVETFLLVQWREGALLGRTPDEAFFVRCDRTTMTQDDLDNGRIIVLVGIAPVRPAEFVILRIGHWTADPDDD